MRGPLLRKKTAINAVRDRQLVAGIEIDGARYHTDDTFLLELLALVTGYQLGLLSGTQAIRTLDNTIVQMEAVQITALAAAVGERRKMIYSESWAAKDSIS